MKSIASGGRTLKPALDSFIIILLDEATKTLQYIESAASGGETLEAA